MISGTILDKESSNCKAGNISEIFQELLFFKPVLMHCLLEHHSSFKYMKMRLEMEVVLGGHMWDCTLVQYG